MNEVEEKSKQNTIPKAVTNDGIPVFCSHDELVPTQNLHPNPRNPNQHPNSQIELLGNIIEKTGWRMPITVSNQSNMIVKGHGRLQAALNKGWSNVPVDYQDYATNEEELADLMADNRLAELSDNDDLILSELIQEVKEADPDLLEMTGYTEEDLQEMLDSIDDGSEEQEEEEEPTKDLSPFAKAGDVWQLGEHRLIVGEDDPVCDGIIANYVYETGNLGCTCSRDGKEYGYMELITAWSVENGMESDMFKMRKPTIIRK